MADGSTKVTPTRVSLPFQPNPFQLDQMPLFGRNDIPRYIFRVHARTTAGKTTLSYVIPPVSACGKTDKKQDIFKLPPRDAEGLLNAHLRCWPSHESECNLMSWTSSLLFALQYGLYRHRGHRDKPDLSQVFLLILDTHRFPKGTFIKHMEIMEVFAQYSDANDKKSLKSFLELRKGDMWYYFGEYLTQGDLNIQGRCVQTNMQRMVCKCLKACKYRRGRYSRLRIIIDGSGC
jgi:hypothetical protein